MRKEKPENQYDIHYPFQTWQGEPLRFVYQEDVEIPNRGYVADRILAYRGDDWVGYMQIDELRSDVYHQLVPHFVNYLDLFGGYSIMGEGNENKHPATFNVDELNLVANRLCSYIGGWGRNIEVNISDYESFEKWLSDQEPDSSILKSQRERMSKHLAHFADRPFVGMVNVANENASLGFKGGHEGQGIARAIYLAAACECAKRGRHLYASSVIQDRAKAVWFRLEQEGFVTRDGERMKLDAEKITAAYDFTLETKDDPQQTVQFGR